jgi:hypothetical protein
MKGSWRVRKADYLKPRTSASISRLFLVCRKGDQSST